MEVVNTEQAPRPQTAFQGRGVMLNVGLHHAVTFLLSLVPIAMDSVFGFPQNLCVETPPTLTPTLTPTPRHTWILRSLVLENG